MLLSGEDLRRTVPLSARTVGLIKHFMRDVNWEDIDVLLVDTPPGTSDEHISIAQLLKHCDSGSEGSLSALVITTPQEISLQDVRRELDFCRKVGIRVAGVVENMSGFTCPKCSFATDIFPALTGGALGLSKEFGVPFLGKVPLDPRVGNVNDLHLGYCCDRGKCFVEEYPDSPSAVAFRNIIDGKFSELFYF